MLVVFKARSKTDPKKVISGAMDNVPNIIISYDKGGELNSLMFSENEPDFVKFLGKDYEIIEIFINVNLFWKKEE